MNHPGWSLDSPPYWSSTHSITERYQWPVSSPLSLLIDKLIPALTTPWRESVIFRWFWLYHLGLKHISNWWDFREDFHLGLREEIFLTRERFLPDLKPNKLCARMGWLSECHTVFLIQTFLNTGCVQHQLTNLKRVLVWLSSNNDLTRSLLSCPFHGWENPSPERLRDLPKAAQLLTGGDEIYPELAAVDQDAPWWDFGAS